MQGHHHFHYVRFLRYACLSVVPLIVLIILITLQSRQWASNILRQNTIDLLDKNTSLIDRDLSNLMINIHQLDSDQELHELFATADYSASNILHIGRNIGDICNRYFFELPGAISLVFHTPQFTFPYYDKFNMPRENDGKFDYYQQLLQSNGEVRWYPTYNLADKLDLMAYAGSKKQDYQVFSIGKLLNLTYYRNEVPNVFPKGVQRPILFINFSPLYFRSMLSTDFLIADTNYAVYDSQGNIIYSSLPELPFSVADLNLLTAPSSEMKGRDHLRYLICQKALGNGCGWSVAAIAPLKYAYSYFSDSLLILALLVLLFTTGYCVAMVALSTRSFAKPFAILTKAIGHTAEGDFGYRIVTTEHSDFQPIFTSYNQMNDQVNQLIRENYEIKLNEKNLEIQVINLQFNPHFIYNTLNTISLLTMNRGEDDISEMICSLSYMMRYSIKVPQGLVPFSKDRKYICCYLSLMQLRFDPPFLYQEKIDPALLDVSMPKFLLQPFIENAILHGFVNHGKLYTLSIEGKLEDDVISFIISDDGEGMNEETLKQLWEKNSDSLGIRNTNHRIKLYYGEQFGVTIVSKPERGTTVTLVLPNKLEKPISD